jgi:glycosyltransferase involved in cell wall biosynthesis
MTACFDPELYYPGANKDDGLVVRTGVAKRTKELETFIRVARRCPEHRFVLIPARNIGESDYPDWLIELNRSLDSPAEILPNLPHRETRDLVQQAAICLHTNALADPFGMSVSIAEAMATGCYVIGRRCDAAESYIGDAGRVYTTEDEAVEQIRATSHWDEENWLRARVASVDRAFRNFEGPKMLDPLYREWLSIAALDARKQ